MEKLSIISLVLISVLFIGVECHGMSQGGRRIGRMQSAPADNTQPLNSASLQYRSMNNKFNNMTSSCQKVWAALNFNPRQFRTALDQSNLTGFRKNQWEEMFRRYLTMSNEFRQAWIQFLPTRGFHPEHFIQFSFMQAQNNTATSSLLPGSKRKQDYTAGQSRKMQKTQAEAGSRRVPGTLRIQEPNVISHSSSSDDSSQSLNEIDLALRMSTLPNRGKNKATPSPRQYKKSTFNPVGRGSAGTSRQPSSAFVSAYDRFDLALAINENSDYVRTPQQALRINNISNSNNLDPGFLSLGINKNSSYTRK